MPLVELRVVDGRTALKLRAEEYASLLGDGCAIDDETDGDYVAPFRVYLPAALARQGKSLEPVPGGWRVRVVTL